MVSSRSNSINSVQDPRQKYLMVAKKGKVLLVFSWYERVKSQKLNTKVAEISKKKKKG